MSKLWTYMEYLIGGLHERKNKELSKKWWFWAIVIIVVLMAFSGMGDNE